MITIEQLAGYLPYELKLKNQLNGIETLTAINASGTILTERNDWSNIAKYKPILKPLEGLDWQQFINDNHRLMSDAIHDFIEYFCDAVNCHDAMICAPYPVFIWCLENHYDVYGLIDNDDAVNADDNF